MDVIYNQTREFVMTTFDLEEDYAINVMSNTVNFGITQVRKTLAAKSTKFGLTAIMPTLEITDIWGILACRLLMPTLACTQVSSELIVVRFSCSTLNVAINKVLKEHALEPCANVIFEE